MSNFDTVQKKLLDFFHIYAAPVLEKLDEANIENLLYKRDNPVFSKEWMRIYTELSTLKKNKSVSSLYVSTNEELRKNIFLQVLKISSQDDLAAYISDDFGLIFVSVVFTYSDEWVNGLWNEYQEKRIPQGELQQSKRQIVLYDGFMTERKKQSVRIILE
ncbi:hypothetical protein [Brevibacillus laterosporus]|uniref:hypothetical protein n=1 Tax=Brevibacillus laterosporus TaxID=1465 RepID=UPI002656A814|nr:hypothetical protein [Brevibacillus laterosporus]MDN9010147.1 hypothetical protein [Brevibacillus laterosporus]MDO0941401.1 hypothetical protein [Brevibacillus laterosporus]